MKVVLRDYVANLGHIGDVVNVSPGYARNFLIPRKLAVVADERNVKALEHERRLIAKRREKALAAARELAERTRSLVVSIPVQVAEGAEGQVKIFGSVTNRDIAEAMTREGIPVDKRSVLLEKPIKSLGEFKVRVRFHPELVTEANISVVRAQG